MAAPIPLSISVGLLSIIAVGFYDLLTNYEKNGCEMTYMFEYPEYQKIELGGIKKEFPHYGLYIYGEGAYSNRIRDLKLSGIPVLFIPGNAGSYKQVRSLGSVALRKAENQGVKVHFNYFVVDFNEELSGLYGGVLERQTNFVHHCLKRIMSLYSGSKHPPTSVVLVGHSMGGMIARALFTLPDFDPSTVNTIITQATPHQRPVAALDSYLQQFYSKVNQHWRDEAAGSLRHVTVVSTGGGYRDIQVRYALTMLNGIVSPDRGVSVSTMAVPKAWVSTDHLCAVWCRQMVLLTKRALFDVVDKTSLQVSTDADYRMKVFHHHFVSNNGLSDYLSREENKTITLDAKISWELRPDKMWKFTDRKTTAAKYFAVPVMVEEDNDALLVTSNLTNPEWICYCDIPAGQDRCTSCTSLSSWSQLLPPLYSNTKYVRVTHADIDVTNNTHVVIMVPAKEKMVNIISDRYNSNERHLVYQMPNTYDSIISYPVSVTDGAAMLKISNASSFYSLHLSGLALPTNTYTAVVMPRGCRKHSAESNEGSVLRLNVPWSNEDTYTFASYGKDISLPIKLQTGRPADYDWQLDASEPHLEMFLHPYCHYQLRLFVATQDGLGQAVRFYAVMCPAYLVAVLMMLLGGVVIAQGKGQVSDMKSESPADTVLTHGKPYYVMPLVMILRFFIRLGPVARLLKNLGVPLDDAASLTEQGVYFTLLPLLLYLTCWLATHLQTFVVFNLMSALSYLGRPLAWIPESISSKTPVLHLVISGVAVALTFLCGTLGLLLTSALLIVKILQLLYVIGRKLDSRDTHRRLTLLFPIMLLVNWQTLLSLGPFIIWLKHIAVTKSWFHSLSPDPSHVPALIVTTCVAVLLHCSDHITPQRFLSAVSGWSTHVLTVAVILYAMESLYRLPVFITLTVVLVTLPHLLAMVTELRHTDRRKAE